MHLPLHATVFKNLWKEGAFSIKLTCNFAAVGLHSLDALEFGKSLGYTSVLC